MMERASGAPPGCTLRVRPWAGKSSLTGNEEERYNNEHPTKLQTKFGVAMGTEFEAVNAEGVLFIAQGRER